MSSNMTAAQPGKTGEMSFDFEGLIQLLAGHLYAEKKVFIRELIQNAHDGIQRRAADDPGFTRERGHIDILTDLTVEPGRIVFRDNGIGMTEHDLERFLSTIGSSGTRAAREQIPELIGQFGIGFLSGFVVGKTVEVRTRHHQAEPEQGWLWTNSGAKDYTIAPCTLAEVGTEVTVYLASVSDRGLVHEDAVKAVVRQYADMLRVPIHVNDPDHRGPPINAMVMPWERESGSPAEARLDAIVYLEKRVPDSVLEVIPVGFDEGVGPDRIHAEGLLYITRTRVAFRDAPRTVRVFLHRMFLGDDAKDLLPPWATFVNGIINTASLSPNAARDNFTHNGSFERLRARLGDIIVAHFDALAQREPERLSKILRYHDLAIKAACYYHDPFFAKFGHLLEWRVNARSAAARSRDDQGDRVALDANYGWATLPEVVAALPSPPDGRPPRLACFTSSSSANQFFEMADAAGTTVVDASYPFERQLLVSWADLNRLELVHVDREDDPEVFRDLDGEVDRPVRALAQLMSQHILPGGTGRLRVEARRFLPDTLPAVLKHSEAGRSSLKAREILDDPNSPSDMRVMAEDMLRLSRNADMRMSINAGNPLIRLLARLAEDHPEDEDLVDLLLGVYNDAILYNQELMSPRNAQIFHQQFQRLLRKSAEFLRERAALARTRAQLDEQQRKLLRQPKRARSHLKAFLMTPFDPAFDRVREAVREVVEGRLGCELQSADQRTFADLITGNVDAHLEDGDFFIADVTGSNPNVMLELGGVLYGRPRRPTLLIAAVAQANETPQLPADLQGTITGSYIAGAELAATVDRLEQQFERHEGLATLLRRERERYVSAATLRDWSRNMLTSKGVYARLSEALPTATAWRQATVAQLKPLLGDQGDAAGLLLERVQAKLPESG